MSGDQIWCVIATEEINEYPRERLLSVHRTEAGAQEVVQRLTPRRYVTYAARPMELRP